MQRAILPMQGKEIATDPNKADEIIDDLFNEAPKIGQQKSAILLTKKPFQMRLRKIPI